MSFKELQEASPQIKAKCSGLFNHMRGCSTGVGYINDSTTVVEGSVLLVQWLV